MKTPLLLFIYVASNLIECTVTLPQSSKQLFTLKTLSPPSATVKWSATSSPNESSGSSPSPSPFFYSPRPLSSPKVSRVKYIKDSDDTSTATNSSGNKSAVGAFSFTYKVKDGNNTIERSEKQQPNGSVVGYYLVKNLISGFLRSIFYEANADTFKASVYSNRPGDVNYTFPTEAPPLIVSTDASTDGQVAATTTTTSGSPAEVKLETTTPAESMVTSEPASKEIATSIEPDFELVTAVVVDTVDTTTIKDMTTTTVAPAVETIESIEEGEEGKEVSAGKEATTSGSIVATGTSSSASGEDITTTTMASVTSATSNSIAGEATSTEAVNEVSSEAISLDPLTIPGGPIGSGEDASTSSSLITTESSLASITTTATSGDTATVSSQVPLLPQLWYEYEILLNGGRFHRSESTDPITGKLIGSYILLMDSTATKLTDPSSTTTTSTTSSTSVSPSTVTSPPSSVPSVPEVAPVDASTTEAVANSLQLLLQSSTTLEPQVQPQLEQEGSTSQAVPVTTTVTSVMSSTLQSLPAGTLVAGSTEEVIRRLRRLRKRHHNHKQQQSTKNNNSNSNSGNIERQQSNRPNVQQAVRSNYTFSLSKRKQVKQVNTLPSEGDARKGHLVNG